MQTVLYLELNGFAMVVLILVYQNLYRNRVDIYLPDQKLFLTMILVNMVILVMDSAMWFFDGLPGLAARWALSTGTAAYYAMNPVIGLLWALYVDFKIYRRKNA